MKHHAGGRLLIGVAAGLVVALSNTGCGQTSPALAQPAGSTPTLGGVSPSPSASPSVAANSGTWRLLPTAPVPAAEYRAVWTGTDVLLHSPAPSASVNAAYNVASGRWRRLRTSPYPVQRSEAGVQAVWDGTEMLTWGTMSAAYNPATDRWRPLRPAPLPAPAVVAWTGHQVIFWGGGCCASTGAAGAAYDPASDSWQMLPPAPIAGRRGTGSVWTGTELIVLGGLGNGKANVDTLFTDGAAYDPTTRTWRRLPPLPAPRWAATITWTGSEVLVVGGLAAFGDAPHADGMAYNPTTNRWRHLPTMGMARTNHVAVWTGQYLLVWGGRGALGSNDSPTKPPNGVAYDPSTNTWIPLPKAPLQGRTGAFAAWTGHELIIWGGSDIPYPYEAFTDAATYRL